MPEFAVTCVHKGTFAGGFVNGLGFVAAVALAGAVIVAYAYYVYAKDR